MTPLLFFVGGALAQTYQSGIGKTTHRVSDALGVAAWFEAHLGLRPDYRGLDCPSGFCACGQIGRVHFDSGPQKKFGIAPSEETDRALGPGTGFGVHAVATNASSERLMGEVSVATVEAHVKRKLRAAASTGGYDGLLDFNTGFWVSDLDPFVREFDSEDTLALEWSDELNNRTFFSLIVQVAGSMVLLEFMSARQTLLPPRQRAPHARFHFGLGEDPESIFGDLSSDSDGKFSMHAARVSHWTSDVDRDAAFYSHVFGRDISLLQTNGGARTLVLSFTDMTLAPNHMQLHLVERSRNDGGFGVTELETAMHAVHSSSVTADVCGYNVWMDMHFALIVADGWHPISDVLQRMEAIDAHGYFVMKTWPNENTLFVISPNGITIQLHRMVDGEFQPSSSVLDGHGGLCQAGPQSCYVQSKAQRAQPHDDNAGLSQEQLEL